MKVTDIAVKHSVSVYVLIFILVLSGISTYLSLPREAAPEIDIPVVVVSTTYAGVSPKDIESLITHPIEKELKEIKDVERLTSRSAESASIITLEFEANVDVALAKQEVREKVDLARPDLPKEADEPVIKSISTSDFPMMIVNVTGPYSLARLHAVAEELQDDIEQVPGVLDVHLAGGVEREIQVRVDPARLNYHGVALHEVTRAIEQENINMPGCDVNLGDASFLVRVPGEFETAEEVENIIVKMRQDHPVYMRDIASVYDSFKARETVSRLDRAHNISLSVTKRGGTNLLEMAANVKALLSEKKPRLPAGTEIVILGDQSKDIKQMVKELENNT